MVAIEAQPDKVSFHCPECKTVLNGSFDLLGKKVRCTNPSCKAQFRLSDASDSFEVHMTELRESLEPRLLRAKRRAGILLWLMLFLVTTNIVFGTIAALLAGESASGSKQIVGLVAQTLTGSQKPPSDLAKGWRYVCGAIAVLSGLSTTSSALLAAFRVADTRSRAAMCASLLQINIDRLRPYWRATELEYQMTKSEIEDIARAFPSILG